MGLSAPWGRGSQQVSVGLRCGGQGGSQLCLVLLEMGRTPGPAGVEGIRVQGPGGPSWGF